MNGRSWITLAGIAVVVVVLALSRGRGEGAEPVAEPSASGLPAVLEFGRGECQACKDMMPVLDAVRDAHAGVVDVKYYDLTEPANAERARDFGVKLIPTQIFVAADGTERFRHEGFLPREEIERRFVEFGWTTSR